MLKYIIIFFIFSILGWIYEYILFKRDKPDGITNKLFNIKLPILPLYGLGGMILLFIYERTKGYPMFWRVFVAAIIINLMECTFGLLSCRFYGYQTWKYDDSMIPLCHGYISIITGIWWYFLTYLIFLGFDKISLKN